MSRDVVERGDVAKAFDIIEVELRSILDGVKAANGGIRSAAERANGAMGRIRDHTRTLSGLTGETQDASKVLADISRDLETAAAEIGRQVALASQLIDKAVETSGAASRTVQRLAQSSSEIGDIIGVISSIASQTNLLALNATIEAARAGEAGRGFAVVASEVKSLATETQRATDQVKSRVKSLRDDAAASIGAVTDVTNVIDSIRPVFSAVAGAVDEQSASIAEVSRSAAKSASVVERVSAAALRIDAEASAAEAINASTNLSGQAIDRLATRIMIVLRENDVANRRSEERHPVNWETRLTVGGTPVVCRTIDISKRGVRLRGDQLAGLSVGQVIEPEIGHLGRLTGRVVAANSEGVHVAVTALPGPMEQALTRFIAESEADNQTLVDRAKGVVQKIEAAFAGGLQARALSEADLFDTAYVENPGTDPVQYAVRYLEFAERTLMPIQETTFSLDPRLAFCAAVDGNGYLPVHNRAYAQTPRPGDRDWNNANCRNKRIFDDRAGLAAAKTSKPFLIQSYPRDMGGGVVIMMKEVDVPIIVAGRRWGALRMAYKI